MRIHYAEVDEVPPTHARRVCLVTRTDHPRGAPETGRERVVGIYRWYWLARLHARALAWFLRHGRHPQSLSGVTVFVSEADVWEDTTMTDEDSS